MLIDTEMFGNAVESNQKAGKQGKFDDIIPEFFIEVGNHDPVKSGVGDKREETAVEAGIIAKDGGMNIDGKDGGNGLGGDKDEDGPVKESVAKEDGFTTKVLITVGNQDN